MRCSRSWLVGGLSMVALSGCSVAPRDTRAVYEPPTEAAVAATPMAQLPAEAGEVVAVLQSRDHGVLTQRVALQGDAQTVGENAIVVKVDESQRRLADLDGPVPKPTESIIQSELDEAFPNLDMRLSLAWNRNSFGPIGHAVGRDGKGLTCVYAWQYSHGRQPLIFSPAVLAASQSQPAAPTSVRVRICRKDMNEREILALIEAMNVYPPNSASPYVDAAYEGSGAKPADALQAADVSVGPRIRSADVAEGAPPRHARHPHKHAARRRAPAVAMDAAPPVPVPPRADVAAVPQQQAALNPLLAPLQTATARPPAVSDMPLPPRSAPGPAVSAPRTSGYSTIPLPN